MNDVTLEMRDSHLMIRQSLVEVMVLALGYWEITTEDSKLELAEKSKIWQTQLDGDGVRTRTLDRYLCLNKLPRYPRWVNVFKTAHYVLNEVPSSLIEISARNRLEGALAKLDLLLAKYYQ